MSFKLGKLKPKFNYKTLYLEHFLDKGLLPTPATKVYREYKIPDVAKQMFGNDRYGDCTCAGVANLSILFSSHTGTLVIPTTEDVLSLYSKVTGFNEQTGENDNGAAMTDVLDYWKTTGFLGNKILGWAQIDHTNETHRQLAVDIFGATYVGVQLPASAQQQFIEGEECHWSVVSGSPIEGGHCIIHPGYGLTGGDYGTWGNWFVKASTAWEQTYIDEEYVVISQEWINKVTNKTPGGLDVNKLKEYLELLKE
jgi:hypothetical protein